MTSVSDRLMDLGSRYAAAWSSQRADRVADFFSEEGILTINDGEPARGRSEIARVAQEFMTAIPDLAVTCDRMAIVDDELRWYWTMKGTDTGLGGRTTQSTSVDTKHWTSTPMD